MVANCWKTLTGTFALRTVTVLVSRMRLVGTAAATMVSGAPAGVLDGAAETSEGYDGVAWTIGARRPTTFGNIVSAGGRFGVRIHCFAAP